jgi:hypothetical protein
MGGGGAAIACTTPSAPRRTIRCWPPPSGTPTTPNPTPASTALHPGYHPYNYPGMGYSTTPVTPTFFHGYNHKGHFRNSLLEMSPYFHDYHTSFYKGEPDKGAEPIMTQLDHHLDIDIRDNQIVQQFRACFQCRGFKHCMVVT